MKKTMVDGQHCPGENVKDGDADGKAAALLPLRCGGSGAHQLEFSLWAVCVPGILRGRADCISNWPTDISSGPHTSVRCTCCTCMRNVIHR